MVPNLILLKNRIRLSFNLVYELNIIKSFRSCSDDKYSSDFLIIHNNIVRPPLEIYASTCAETVCGPRVKCRSERREISYMDVMKSPAPDRVINEAMPGRYQQPRLCQVCVCTIPS